ncbi:MAG: 2-phosphosulfolactate phosphatase [Planctomycetaceae bacterium]|nr:2-phosphosulfolactate phosphatase [Planctomycetaceae bacterium]
MPEVLRTHLLPRLFEPHELCGSTAVVIDILRASTTITHALAAGAGVVLPAEEVESARSLAEQRQANTGETVLLGGERGGERIEEFDLGNSPLQYTEEAVGGKTIVFTSTNGTQALARSAEAERVFLGAFANLSALIRVVTASFRPVHLVCAGTNGRISAEDVLFAGALASAIVETRRVDSVDDDATRLAIDSFAKQGRNSQSLYEAFTRSHGGRNLTRLGFDADIRRAAERDLFDVVPEFDAQSGTIQAARITVDQ